MGVRFICDGCECPIEQGETRRFGWVAQVWYCAKCKKEWEAVEKDLDRSRVELVKEFEVRRKAKLEEARKRLKVIPDE